MPSSSGATTSSRRLAVARQHVLIDRDFHQAEAPRTRRHHDEVVLDRAAHHVGRDDEALADDPATTPPRSRTRSTSRCVRVQVRVDEAPL
jgi:hypothetical protein